MSGELGAVSELEHVLVLSDAISARLAAAGIEPVRSDVPGSGPRQLFFSDPEGLRIEINVKA